MSVDGVSRGPMLQGAPWYALDAGAHMGHVHGGAHPCSSCTNLEEAPQTMARDDLREHFTAAWCIHPRIILHEKIIAIPEPDVPFIVEPPSTFGSTKQSALSYWRCTTLCASRLWRPWTGLHHRHPMMMMPLLTAMTVMTQTGSIMASRAGPRCGHVATGLAMVATVVMASTPVMADQTHNSVLAGAHLPPYSSCRRGCNPMPSPTQRRSGDHE